MTVQRPIPVAKPEKWAGRTDSDAGQAGLTAVRNHFEEMNEREEMEGQEEPEITLAWVSLDIPRGLLVCWDTGMEARQSIGTLMECRLVRVMKERDGKDREGAVLCASSNRLTADLGRPGRECADCEERSACCFPRWRIAWQTEDSGQVFAHTLCRTGTLNLTRYAARLKREGLTPGQVITRLFVEDAKWHTASMIRRHIRFEKVG